MKTETLVTLRCTGRIALVSLNRPARHNALVGQLNEAILAIYTHPAPVACAVHGQVTGGSLGLLLAADHVIMRRDVTITPWYSVVGFSPDGGWTALLPDIIGRRQTMHWLAGNTSFDADTCLALGLADQVAEDDCDGAALQWGQQVAEQDTGGVCRTRKLLHANSAVLRQRLEAERENFASRIQTKTALDGIDLFLRRREHV